MEDDLGALRRHLDGDGYTIDDYGLIRELDAQTLTGPTRSQLSDPSALEEYLRRLLVTSNTDPPLAISCGALLVRSTAKYVLEELGEEYDDKADLIELAELAQKALNIHSETIASDGDGSETIVSTLSHISHVAIGVAKLLNQSQSDHRKYHPAYSLKSRHARLAVGERGHTVYSFLIPCGSDAARPSNTAANPTLFANLGEAARFSASPPNVESSRFECGVLCGAPAEPQGQGWWPTGHQTSGPFISNKWAS